MSLHIKLNLIGVLCPLRINCCVFAYLFCSKIKLARAFFILVPTSERVALSCKFAWIACILIFFNYLFRRSCAMSLDIKLNLIGVLCPLRINCCVFAYLFCSKVKLACAFFVLVPATECVALSCKFSRILCICIFLDYLFSWSCSMSLYIKLNLIGVLCPLRINCCVFAYLFCSKIKLACAFFVLIPATECIALSR